ncbi:MAG: hypothetical protein KTR25_09110 [Myxococcales bacterium]|nr:hypothetical protein [Myxococcales bacterium]
MSLPSGCGDDAVARGCEGLTPEGGVLDAPDRGARKGSKAAELSQMWVRMRSGALRHALARRWR